MKRGTIHELTPEAIVTTKEIGNIISFLRNNYILELKIFHMSATAVN